jgi:phosphoglycolate phosphatase-like HAD superfamily hydrolase
VGIHSVAVTWGGFDLQILRAAKAEALIDKPAELPRLLQ